MRVYSQLDDADLAMSEQLSGSVTRTEIPTDLEWEKRNLLSLGPSSKCHWPRLTH